MTNLTISLDEGIIRNARLRAIHEGTSVSAKIREFLANYAQEAARPAPGQAFLDAAAASEANRDAASWSRADAYDRTYPGQAA